MNSITKEILLETIDLSVRFPVKKSSPFERRRYVHAVRDVSIAIPRGETFGIVGESGCGKSTFANATLGLVPFAKGEVWFDKERLDPKNRESYKRTRRRMQKIFQDPGASLNPRFTALEAVREPLRIRGGFPKQEEIERASEMLARVGISERDRRRFTGEFSGGQQQRIAIARSLVLSPEYLVLDEPVSALDVSVHAQILNLLIDMQRELGVTYLFISHNLAVVRKLSSRIAIMYLGQVVETGRAESIFAEPRHPYTRALMSAVLEPGDTGRERIVLKGDVASPIDIPQGCAFASRCPMAKAGCTTAETALRQVGDDHFTSCPYEE